MSRAPCLCVLVPNEVQKEAFERLIIGRNHWRTGRDLAFDHYGRSSLWPRLPPLPLPPVSQRSEASAQVPRGDVTLRATGQICRESELTDARHAMHACHCHCMHLYARNACLDVRFCGQLHEEPFMKVEAKLFATMNNIARVRGFSNSPRIIYYVCLGTSPTPK